MKKQRIIIGILLVFAFFPSVVSAEFNLGGLTEAIKQVEKAVNDASKSQENEEEVVEEIVEEVIEEAKKVAKNEKPGEVKKVEEAVEVIEEIVEAAQEVKKVVKEPGQTSVKIEPFGGLGWRDSLVEVTTKLNGLKDVESIQLKRGYDGIDIAGISSKDALIKKLEELMALVLSPREDYMYTSYKSDNSEIYYDKEGFEKIYLTNRRYNIIVNPIIIAELPFKLEAKFSVAPGLLLQNEDAILVENRRETIFPLILTSVQLTANAESPLYGKEKFREIVGILKNKYGEFWANTRTGKVDFEAFINLGVNMWIGDVNGGAIEVISPYGQLFMIHYASIAYTDKLAELYEAHLVKLAKAKSATKKDMSDGL